MGLGPRWSSQWGSWGRRRWPPPAPSSSSSCSSLSRRGAGQPGHWCLGGSFGRWWCRTQSSQVPSRAGAVTVPAVTPPLAADNAQLGGEKYIWCGYTTKCLGEYKYVCKHIFVYFLSSKAGTEKGRKLQRNIRWKPHCLLLVIHLMFGVWYDYISTTNCKIVSSNKSSWLAPDIGLFDPSC